MKTEFPWEAELCPCRMALRLSGPDRDFSLFFLWTQGGSRALSLARCRVDVGWRSLPPSSARSLPAYLPAASLLSS